MSWPCSPPPCARRPRVMAGWRWCRGSRASARPNWPAPSPARLGTTARCGPAGAPVDRAVGTVAPGLGAASPPLVLAGLSAGDIRLMLPGADADVLAVVQRRSEGNPLFVSQVARLLGPGAATVEEVPVPAGIRQAVRRQVGRLADAQAATRDTAPGAEEILATAAA